MNKKFILFLFLIILGCGHKNTEDNYTEDKLPETSGSNIAPVLNDLFISGQGLNFITLGQPTFSISGNPTPVVNAYIGVNGIISIEDSLVSNFIEGPVDVSSDGYQFSDLDVLTDYQVIVVAENTEGYSAKQIIRSTSPNIEWQKSLGGSKVDYAKSIQQTNDGGYVVVGHSHSIDGDVIGNHGEDDIWVVKLDASGNMIWQKCLGGSKDDRGSLIRQTIDGGYIVVGSSDSNDGDLTTNNGNGDYWVIKLDASGNIVWQKSLGGSKDDYATSVLEISLGYIVVGGTYSDDGDITINYGNEDVWIVKLDVFGNVIWQKSLGGTHQDTARSIQQTADGGYILAGWSSSNDGDVTLQHGGADYWVVKLDASGNIVWQKSLGGSLIDYAYSIEQTRDAGYIVAGVTFSHNGDVSNSHEGERDAWIVKLDVFGNIIWQKCLGGSNYDVAQSIKQTNDGGYIILGWSKSNDGDVTGLHGTNNDYWVIKLDTFGNIIWQKCLGGTRNDYGREIQQTSDDGYIITGASYSHDGDITEHNGEEYEDFWIVKLEP